MTLMYDPNYAQSRLKDVKVMSPMDVDERRKRLAPIFAGMHINMITQWATAPGTCIEEFDVGVRVVFHNKVALLYDSVETLCEVVDALELFCSGYKPCPLIKDFMIKHQGMKYTIAAIEKASRTRGIVDVKDALHIDPTARQAGLLIATMPSVDESEDDIDLFSPIPYKIIRNYLYACAFLDCTPDLLDRMNALLGYRLGQAISEKKEPAEAALKYLCQELNDFARSHADGGFGLCAVFKQDIFGNTVTDAIIVTSDYGTVEVQHEPHLNAVDWENRFRDMSRRYGR